jgi:hypothetical protein
MIYRSNLQAPDLSPFFQLRNPPLQILGHDMPSDPDFDPNCGFWTHDEAAILYQTALRVPGAWFDVGARLGWTAAHIAAAPGVRVDAVDPELKRDNFSQRFTANVKCAPTRAAITQYAITSGEFFSNCGPNNIFSGVVIDGNHDWPEPQNDAAAARAFMAETAVVLFHDFQGAPVRAAVTDMLNAGWSAKVYDTPNGVAVCWRGAFRPVDHVPDPAIDWAAIRSRYYDFDYTRCA